MALGFELEGKRALVTGAGQGVGRGIASMLAAAGAGVVVNDAVAARAEEAVAELQRAGGAATAAPFDVTDFDAVTEACRRLGPVDILVNNAGNAGIDGWGAMAAFVDTTPADWARYLDVNLRGVMHCVHATLPAMIAAGWGRVITVVSDAARSGEPMMAAYCAAKAGAAGFCRGIAREVGRHGVTVNSIALGTMRTPASAARWDDPAMAAARQAALAGYVVRRPGEPEDAGWLVVALASPRASWITGQTYPVDGGYSFAL